MEEKITYYKYLKRFSAYHENLKLYLPLKYLIVRIGCKSWKESGRVTLKMGASGSHIIPAKDLKFVDFSLLFCQEG